MTQIKSFTKNDIAALRKEYQAAIDAVSEKYGLTGELGRILFDETEFRCKLTVSNPTLQFSSLKKPAGVTNTNDSSYIGRSYKLRNSVYTIKSVKSHGVLLASNQNGRLFRIKVTQLADMIAL